MITILIILLVLCFSHAIYNLTLAAGGFLIAGIFLVGMMIQIVGLITCYALYPFAWAMDNFLLYTKKIIKIAR